MGGGVQLLDGWLPFEEFSCPHLKLLAVNLSQCWSQLGSLLWLKNALKCSMFCSQICPVDTIGQQCSKYCCFSWTQNVMFNIYVYILEKNFIP